MPSSGAITTITPPRVPLIDRRTGLISREWYRFFLNQFKLTGSGENPTSLLDLQKAPPTIPIETIQIDPDAADKNPVASVLVSELAELDKQVEGLEVAPVVALQEAIDELQKQIQALQIVPPPRGFKRSRYGSFYDTTTQTATTINTAKAITFNTTDLSQGVYVGTTTSRIYVDTEGVYDFQTSLQLDSTVATDEHFYLWFAVNGVDVANSASTVRLKGNNSELILALNFFLDLKAGDYVELMYSVTNLGVNVLYAAASPPVPAIPSIILTVSNNIQGVQ